VPVLKSTTNNVSLQAGGLNVVTAVNNSGAAVLEIGQQSGAGGRLQLDNATNSNVLVLQSSVTANSYTMQLPTDVGVLGRCLVVSGVSGSVETLDYAKCGNDSFLQGGNGFGATAVLGTTDSNDLQLTTNGTARVTVAGDGSQVAISNGTSFVLGSKTSSDPTGSNGAMYYNSTSNSFRCYENGVWRSCLGGLVNSSTAASSAVASTSSLTNFSGGTNNSYGVLANDCQAGVTYTVTASGVYSTTGAPTLRLFLNEDGTGTSLSSTSAITTPSGASNLGWQLTAQMICVDTTHVEVQGSVTIGNVTTDLSTSAIVALMQNSGTAAWTTSAHTLYIGAQWGTSSASNTITMRQFIVQRVGP